MTLDPIDQFNINNLFTIGHIGGYTIASTNSSAYMLLIVAVVCLVGVRGFKEKETGARACSQSAAELTYVFVSTLVRTTAGEEGMKFFPLVFSIFMFIPVANVIGIIPYTFTVTSHIIITAAFALLVFFTVFIYGFHKNGLRFLRSSCQSGIPITSCRWSSRSRSFLPVATALAQRRLFANMLAGHITLKVFAGFVACSAPRSVRSAGSAAWCRGIDRSADRARTLGRFFSGLRVSVLTCIYLNDALHPGH